MDTTFPVIKNATTRWIHYKQQLWSWFSTLATGATPKGEDPNWKGVKLDVYKSALDRAFDGYEDDVIACYTYYRAVIDNIAAGEKGARLEPLLNYAYRLNGYRQTVSDGNLFETYMEDRYFEVAARLLIFFARHTPTPPPAYIKSARIFAADLLSRTTTEEQKRVEKRIFDWVCDKKLCETGEDVMRQLPQVEPEPAPVPDEVAVVPTLVQTQQAEIKILKNIDEQQKGIIRTCIGYLRSWGGGSTTNRPSTTLEDALAHEQRLITDKQAAEDGARDAREEARRAKEEQENLRKELQKAWAKLATTTDNLNEETALHRSALPEREDYRKLYEQSEANLQKEKLATEEVTEELEKAHDALREYHQKTLAERTRAEKAEALAAEYELERNQARATIQFLQGEPGNGNVLPGQSVDVPGLQLQIVELQAANEQLRALLEKQQSENRAVAIRAEEMEILSRSEKQLREELETAKRLKREADEKSSLMIAQLQQRIDELSRQEASVHTGQQTIETLRSELTEKNQEIVVSKLAIRAAEQEKQQLETTVARSMAEIQAMRQYQPALSEFTASAEGAAMTEEELEQAARLILANEERLRETSTVEVEQWRERAEYDETIVEEKERQLEHFEQAPTLTKSTGGFFQRAINWWNGTEPIIQIKFDTVKERDEAVNQFLLASPGNTPRPTNARPALGNLLTMGTLLERKEYSRILQNRHGSDRLHLSFSQDGRKFLGLIARNIGPALTAVDGNRPVLATGLGKNAHNLTYTYLTSLPRDLIPGRGWLLVEHETMASRRDVVNVNYRIEAPEEPGSQAVVNIDNRVRLYASYVAPDLWRAKLLVINV
jgi:hypothetical protein